MVYVYYMRKMQNQCRTKYLIMICKFVWTMLVCKSWHVLAFHKSPFMYTISFVAFCSYAYSLFSRPTCIEDLTPHYINWHMLKRVTLRTQVQTSLLKESKPFISTISRSIESEIFNVLIKNPQKCLINMKVQLKPTTEKRKEKKNQKKYIQVCSHTSHET